MVCGRKIRRNKMKKFLSILTAILLIMCMAVGCTTRNDKPNGGNGGGGNGGGGNGGGSGGGGSAATYEYKKESDDMIYFSSSDADFDAFINDFLHRHLSYDDDAIYPLTMGQGSWFSKEWESMAMKYFDISEKTLGSDHYDIVMDLVDNRVIDKYGYVWNGWHQLEDAEHPQSGTQFMQGWTFPHQGHNIEDPCYEWEFRDSDWESAKDNLNWHSWIVDSDDVTIDTTVPYSRGYLTADLSKSNKIKEIVFESENIDYTSFYMPFLEIDLRLTDATSFGIDSSLDDFYIEFKTKQTGDTWHRVYQKEYNTRPFMKIPAMFAQRIYFPMYLNEYWLEKTGDAWLLDGAKNVTKLRIGFETKADKTFTGEININYVRPEFDTRRADNQAIYIGAVRNMFEFLGDKAMLKKYLPKVRSSISFYLKHLKGESGLLTVGELVGHEGYRAQTGQGIGNGYWDIQITPAVNLYSNIYFYRALEATIYLEKTAKALGVTAENPTVLLWDNTPYTYDYSVEALESLFSEVKANMEKDVEDGGFWNPETGRFVPGINPEPWEDTNAEKYYDFGWTTYNLEALAAGIGTDAQVKSVLDWISGERIVDGEDATGEDIYTWEFAPVVNTVNNRDYLFWAYTPLPYGDQLQNGGAVLYLEYYDLMSRLRAYGGDGVFDRFKLLQKWYDKVSAAGGEGETFYYTYYEQEGIVLEGWDGNGQIGIDTVFMESTIMATAMPDAFYGMKAKDYYTLDFNPALPTKLNYMKMENVVFRGAKLDVTIGHDFFRLDSVRGGEEGLKVLAKVKAPTGTYKVYMNDTELSSSAYRVENGYVVVETDLKDVVITVK